MKEELPTEEAKRLLELVSIVIERERMRSEREFLLSNGLNPTIIYKVRTGKQLVPPALVNIMANKYGANVTYIYTGQGDKFLEQATQSESNVQTTTSDISWVELPLITERATASFVESFNSHQGYEGTEETVRVAVYPGESLPKGAVVVKVYGDSMEPQLQDGAQILIAPVNPADFKYISSGVYAVAYGSFFVVKRIKDNDLLRHNFLTLHSDNPKAGHTVVEWKDLRGIWKVLEIVRSTVR